MLAVTSLGAEPHDSYSHDDSAWKIPDSTLLTLGLGLGLGLEYDSILLTSGLGLGF